MHFLNSFSRSPSACFLPRVIEALIGTSEIPKDFSISKCCLKTRWVLFSSDFMFRQFCNRGSGFGPRHFSDADLKGFALLWIADQFFQTFYNFITRKPPKTQPPHLSAAR